MSVEDVEAVLTMLDHRAPIAPLADRDVFAFNVLTNALGATLQRIRMNDPELGAAYADFARAMLRDD